MKFAPKVTYILTLVVAWPTGAIDRHAGYNYLELVTQDECYPKILVVNKQVCIINKTRCSGILERSQRMGKKGN